MCMCVCVHLMCKAEVFVFLFLKEVVVQFMFSVGGYNDLRSVLLTNMKCDMSKASIVIKKPV